MTQDREAQVSLLNHMKKIHGVNVSMIAAVSRNLVIGDDGQLPWSIPDDLQYFKEQTLGKTVIMGKNTYLSIGRFLPGRKNVVVTRDSVLLRKGAAFQNSIQGAVCEALQEPNEIMVIGGGEIYRQFLPYTNRLLITEVFATIDGDVKFPEFDDTLWDTKVGDIKEHNGLKYRFVVHTRKSE